MSLIIILLAVFNNKRSGALICYHRRPISLLVPQSRKRGYAPAGWHFVSSSKTGGSLRAFFSQNL